MFRLVLHATHENKREDIMISVISTCNDLVFEEFHVNTSLVFMFIFVISNKNRSTEETRDQEGENNQEEVLIENQKPVDCQINTFILIIRGQD